MTAIRRAAAFAASCLALVATTATAQVERVRVDSSPFSLGTLTPAGGALPRTLWEGSDRDEVADLLTAVPTRFGESLHLELLRRVLLSPGEGPDGADNALAGLKLMVASRAGFYDDAADLAALVPGTSTEPMLSQVIAYRELMDGDVDTACARGAGLRDGRADPFWIKLRYLCYVRAGEQSAAELTFNILRRQDILSRAEERRFTRFGRGDTIDVPDGPVSLFDWVMLTEGGATIDDDFLDQASPGVNAAVARRAGLPEPVRGRALVRALYEGTIGPAEAEEIIGSLPTATLAEDLVMVTAAQAGSLEQTEALGRALRRPADDYRGFVARARLFAQSLSSATPVQNFAPHGDTLALAAMVNGQTAVAERWLLALANDASQPAGAARAAALVQLYLLKEPGAARRIASYLNLTLEDVDPVALDAPAIEPEVPLATLVRAGLGAAGASGTGPASLVYLMSTATVPDADGIIHQTVTDWSRGDADLRWMDREAAFRGEVSAALSGALDVPAVAPAALGAGSGPAAVGGTATPLPEAERD